MQPIFGLALIAAQSYGIDETIFRVINLAGTNALLDALMVFFTTLGLTYVLALLVIPLWWRGHKDAAFDLLVLLLVVMVVTEAIKYVANAARPCDVLPDVHLVSPGACAAEVDPAFPSGHTSRAFAVAALLAYRLRWKIGGIAFVVAFLIGLSRIYLGVHWPSDVLGGAVLGVGMALLLRVIETRSERYRTARARVISWIERLYQRPRPT